MTEPSPSDDDRVPSSEELLEWVDGGSDDEEKDQGKVWAFPVPSNEEIRYICFILAGGVSGIYLGSSMDLAANTSNSVLAGVSFLVMIIAMGSAALISHFWPLSDR